MFNSYVEISSVSPSFVKLTKKERDAITKAREAAIEQEVLLAKLCQEHNVSFSSASNNRLEKESPSVALIIGDQVHRWKQHGNAVQQLERALSLAESTAMADSKVQAEMADEFVELQTILVQTDAAMRNALDRVSKIEGGVAASKQLTDLLRTARGGKNSLVKGIHNTEADALTVAARIGDFARAMVATESAVTA